MIKLILSKISEADLQNEKSEKLLNQAKILLKYLENLRNKLDNIYNIIFLREITDKNLEEAFSNCFTFREKNFLENEFRLYYKALFLNEDDQINLCSLIGTIVSSLDDCGSHINKFNIQKESFNAVWDRISPRNLFSVIVDIKKEISDFEKRIKNIERTDDNYKRNVEAFGKEE